MLPAGCVMAVNENRLHIFRTICNEPANIRAAYAFVGGLAVSARTEPRFTKDLDLAIAVTDDREAETLVAAFRSRGYQIEALVEQEATARLATVRLVPPTRPALFVDLLFASSGIEPEIVAAAEPLEIIEGLVLPVATIAYLIATKVLSRDDVQRPQDLMDLNALVREASETDLTGARAALRMVAARGFHRGKDLIEDLETLLRSFRA